MEVRQGDQTHPVDGVRRESIRAQSGPNQEGEHQPTHPEAQRVVSLEGRRYQHIRDTQGDLYQVELSRLNNQGEAQSDCLVHGEVGTTQEGE